MNTKEAIKAVRDMNLSTNDTQAIIDVMLDLMTESYCLGYDDGYSKAREDCW